MTLAHKRRILGGVNSPDRPVPAGSPRPDGEFTLPSGVRLPQADESREAGGQKADELRAWRQAWGRYWGGIAQEAAKRNREGRY